MKNKRKRVCLSFPRPENTHVKQSFKKDTDINTILDRVKMGDLSVFDRNKGVYADLFDMPEDLSAAYERVNQIDGLFAELPSRLRKKFDHDPQAFAEWIDTHKMSDLTDLIKEVWPESKPLPDLPLCAEQQAQGEQQTVNSSDPE